MTAYGPTEEERKLTAGMPAHIAAGFIMARRGKALEDDIKSSIERQMRDDPPQAPAR